jgi:CubicO group peptidase (beta-lactamase class C family)
MRVSSLLLGMIVIRVSAGCGAVVSLSDEPVYSMPRAVDDGWRTRSAESLGISPAPLLKMERAIAAREFRRITSVLIARRGFLAYEAYFDGTGAATLRNTRSATKAVTGMLVGIAIDRGLLEGVDAPIMTFFPDRQPVRNPDPLKDRITIEDFLTMSSWLDCDDNDPKSPGNEERMYKTHDWVRFTLDLPVRQPLRSSPQTLQHPSSPGFCYCTAGVTTWAACWSGRRT